MWYPFSLNLLMRARTIRVLALIATFTKSLGALPTNGAFSTAIARSNLFFYVTNRFGKLDSMP